MLDDSTSNVSVDGSTNWGRNATVSIQHQMPGQVIKPQASALPDQPAGSVAADHAATLAESKPITLTEGGSYPVAHGDTLDSIAAQHNLSAAELKTLNPELQNQAGVYPGQLLTVQAQPAAVPPPTTPALTIGPSQSTYTMANKNELEAAVHKELSGWLGTAGVATDPAKNLIEAAEKPKTDTNPLKIDHK